MVEARQPLQHGALKEDAERADDQRRQDQRPPVVDAEKVQKEICDERAHHIERAVRKIDDVEHPEDDGQPKTKQRVKRAVDQSDQKLGVESLHRIDSFARSWRRY